MNENLNGPSKPGEGVEWKVGSYVYVRRPKSRHGAETTILAEFTKVGRKWAEVSPMDGSYGLDRARFNMQTGLEDSSWMARSLWVSPDAIERSEDRLRREREIQEWARFPRLGNLSSLDLFDLWALLVAIGEIR